MPKQFPLSAQDFLAERYGFQTYTVLHSFLLVESANETYTPLLPQNPKRVCIIFNNVGNEEVIKFMPNAIQGKDGGGIPSMVLGIGDQVEFDVIRHFDLPTYSWSALSEEGNKPLFVWEVLIKD